MAEMMLGVAISLVSGADTALVYDTLKEAGREEQYLRVEGRMGGIAGYSEATGGLIGAWLASFSLVYPFYLLFVFNLMAICIILSLREPERETTIHAGPDPKRMLTYLRSTFWQNRSILWLTINGSVGGVATFLIVWYSQAYMDLVQIPIVYFGVAWAVFHVVMGSFSLWAAKIEQRLGSYQVFLAMAVLTVVSYVLLGAIEHVLGLVFIALLYATRGVRTVLVRKHLNRQLSSDLRATALSVYSFIFRIIWAVFGTFFGWLTGLYSLPTSFIVAGVMLGAVMLWTYFRMIGAKSLDDELEVVKD
jgi:MFS family permease